MTQWRTSDGRGYAGQVYNVDEKKGVAFYSVPWLCGRCGGQGGSDAWKFTGGTCYECGGSGHRGRTKAIKVYTQVAYDKLSAARVKRESVKAAKEVAKHEAAKVAAAIALENFRVENAVLIADLNAYAGRNAFIHDLRAKLHEYGSLSEKQVDAVHASLDRAAKESMAADCPSGRVTVCGEVVSTKSVESQYGITLKMLVRAVEGFKVWCTVPAKLTVERGTTVKFTVTLEPSADDPKFGFGKRPVVEVAK